MKVEYRPALVNRSSPRTYHLTADGRQTLCGRPVREVLVWSVAPIVRAKCRMCLDAAWSREFAEESTR